MLDWNELENEDKYDADGEVRHDNITYVCDVIEFPVSSDIDSVLYTVSGDGLEFEQILKTNENSLQAINQDGNHTI